MEHIEADAESPDVAAPAVEAATDAHLGGHEGWSAHGAQHGVAPLEHVRAAKVRDLDLAIRGHEQIVGLQVAMHNLVEVQVVQALQRQHAPLGCHHKIVALAAQAQVHA